MHGSRVPGPAACRALARAAPAVLLALVALAHRADAQLATSQLATRWAKDVTPERVLPEYPRPQMTRPAWTNLNGRWDYAIRDREAAQPDRWDGTILVPFPVESQLSGVHRSVSPGERLWYRRTFRAPARPTGGRLLLHAGAIDWDATIYVNGRDVGRHRGGYDPITVDITDALTRGGDQQLVVGVEDPTDAGDQPHGKQVRQARSIWYTAVTGIWQTIWLEPVPASWIRSLQVTADVDAGMVHVRVDAAGAPRGTTVRVIARAAGAAAGQAGGPVDGVVDVPLPSPHLWAPGDPFLYDLSVQLSTGDSVGSYVGMRKIAVARDAAGTPRLFLNDKPLFQFGLLDQGWWPDGLYTAPTDEALASDIETTLRLGFNFARKHVKVEPDRWYYHADRLGLLVWQDMPSAGNATPEGRREFDAELRRVVDALRNHPSIVMWVPFNEGWGQHDTWDHVAWLANLRPHATRERRERMDRRRCRRRAGRP